MQEFPIDCYRLILWNHDVGNYQQSVLLAASSTVITLVDPLITDGLRNAAIRLVLQLFP